jgi:hypothetical protein
VAGDPAITADELRETFTGYVAEMLSTYSR